MHSPTRPIARSLATALSFTLLLNQFAHAAAPPSSPEDLARARLLAAHTVFLAPSTQDANFPASPDDAFNLVRSSLNAWGRFQIVDTVAQADLVLQLRDTVKTAVVDNQPNDPGSSVYFLPSFQLTLADPSTLSPLWTISSAIPTAARHKNQPALLQAVADNLVSRLKLLVGDPLTARDHTAQRQIDHYKRTHLGLILGLTAAGLALTLGLFFIARHNAQQSQAAFCAQHGITPCPGA